MKNPIRKLVVRRESICTLRTLDDKELGRVVGGETHDACMTLAVVAPGQATATTPRS